MTVTSRRVSFLLLAALLAASCGGDDGGDGGGGDGDGDVDASACPVDALESAEGPVEITFWHAMGGAEIEATLVEVTDAYNASQDRVVVDLVNQQGYLENFTAFRDSAAEDRPDLLQLPEYRLQAMADSGLVIPAAACVEAAGFDVSALLPELRTAWQLGNAEIGIVEGADFLIWQRGLGTEFEASDLADWRANFGSTGGGPGAQGSVGPVPEPATALISAIAALGLFVANRRAAVR